MALSWVRVWLVAAVAVFALGLLLGFQRVGSCGVLYAPGAPATGDDNQPCAGYTTPDVFRAWVLTVGGAVATVGAVVALRRRPDRAVDGTLGVPDIDDPTRSATRP